MPIYRNPPRGNPPSRGKAAGKGASSGMGLGFSRIATQVHVDGSMLNPDAVPQTPQEPNPYQEGPYTPSAPVSPTLDTPDAPAKQAEEKQPEPQQAEQIEDDDDDEEEVTAAGEKNVAIPLLGACVHNGVLKTAGFAVKVDKNGNTHCWPIRSVVNVGSEFGYEGPVKFGLDYSRVPELDKAIRRTKADLVTQADKDKLRETCGELVQRARNGDQNAMALISCARENAANGNKLALRTMSYVKAYIDKVPEGSFGFEKEDREEPLDYRTVVEIANGAPLNINRVFGMASTFGSDGDRDAFLFGVMNHRKKGKVHNRRMRSGKNQKRLIDVGCSIGEAKALQNVRKPGASIKAFDEMAGWELGE